MSVGSVSNVSQASSLAPASRFQWLQTLKAVDVRIVALAVGLVCVLALAIRWWRGAASPVISAPSLVGLSSIKSPKEKAIADITAALKSFKNVETWVKAGFNTDDNLNLSCYITLCTNLPQTKGTRLKDKAIVYMAREEHFIGLKSNQMLSGSWKTVTEQLPMWLDQHSGNVEFLVLAKTVGLREEPLAKVVSCNLPSAATPTPSATQPPVSPVSSTINSAVIATTAPRGTSNSVSVSMVSASVPQASSLLSGSASSAKQTIADLPDTFNSLTSYQIQTCGKEGRMKLFLASSPGMTIDQAMTKIIRALEVSAKADGGEVVQFEILEKTEMTTPLEGQCSIFVYDGLTREVLPMSIDEGIRKARTLQSQYRSVIVSPPKDCPQKHAIINKTLTEFQELLPKWLEQFVGNKVGFVVVGTRTRGESKNPAGQALICDFSNSQAKPLPSSAATTSAATVVSSSGSVAAVSVDTSRNGKIQAAIELIRKAANKATAGGRWEGASVTVKNTSGFLIEGWVTKGQLVASDTPKDKFYEVDGFRYDKNRENIQDYTFYTEVLPKKLRELSSGKQVLNVRCEPERGDSNDCPWVSVTVDL